MEKKILCVLISIVSLFILTGCDKSTTLTGSGLDRTKWQANLGYCGDGTEGTSTITFRSGEYDFVYDQTSPTVNYTVSHGSYTYNAPDIFFNGSKAGTYNEDENCITLDNYPTLTYYKK